MHHCGNLLGKHFSINHLHSQFNRWNAIHFIHFSSAPGLNEVWIKQMRTNDAQLNILTTIYQTQSKRGEQKYEK